MLPAPGVSPSKSAALADLDEVLRALLEAELEKVGISRVMISFEAPTRERTSAWPSPAINLFLYDLREASSPRDRSFHERPAGIGTVLQQAPMRLACTFAITVWTSEVRDEHQILSQVLSILLAYPTIPAERLAPSLLVGEPAGDLMTRVGQAKEEGRADFWATIGTPYKVSLEYMVTILCVAGIEVQRGALVERRNLTGTLGTEERLAGEPVHPLSGRVVGPDGEGVGGVWVSVAAGRHWTETGGDGRFFVYGIPAGEHVIEARAADGSMASRSAVVVPGADARLTLEPRA